MLRNRHRGRCIAPQLALLTIITATCANRTSSLRNAFHIISFHWLSDPFPVNTDQRLYHTLSDHDDR